MTGFGVGKNKPFTTKEIEEAVTTRNEVTTIQGDEHQPQFVTAYTCILCTNLLDGFYDFTFMLLLLYNVSL